MSMMPKNASSGVKENDVDIILALAVGGVIISDLGFNSSVVAQSKRNVPL